MPASDALGLRQHRKQPIDDPAALASMTTPHPNGRTETPD